MMKASKKCKLTLLGATITSLILFSDHFPFSFPVSGSVVDNSGNPITGAVVTASWQASRPLGGTVLVRVQETRTDNQGKFTIHGWGPNWTGFSHLAVYDSEPEIWIAKRGYLPIRLLNEGDKNMPHARALNLTPESKLHKVRLDPLPAALDRQASLQVVGIAGVSAAMAFPGIKCTRQIIPMLADELGMIQAQARISKPTYFEGQNACKVF